MPEKKKILFVCLGNIVRSPLAEHMFIKTAREAGVYGNYEVDSAGTSGYHIGESPDKRMRQVAAEFGLIYDGASRHFKREDYAHFDHIIVMDASNYDNVIRLASTENDREKIALMREFDSEAEPEDSVPDPYYGGIQGFYTTYEIVERSVKGFLAALENGTL